MNLYWSKGPLRYGIDNAGRPKLNVMVDPGIVSLYRALVPAYKTCYPQMYPAHISVVRKEDVPRMDLWGKYEGEEVDFAYTDHVYNGTVYWWLNAFSTRLEEIRVELGLPITSLYTRPPDTFEKVFHITIGNMKPRP